MRWLLLKDLQILRRSPLLVSLLVIYPVVVAVLIGFALSRGPSKPRVAVVNQIPAAQDTFQVGNTTVRVSDYARELYQSIQPVFVATRAQALRRVRSGEVLAALIVPADFARRLASGTSQARVDVIYNGDALQQQVVQNAISSKLADANFAVSDQLRRVASSEIDLLLSGGNFAALGQNLQILGLAPAKLLLDRVVAQLPRGPNRNALSRVDDFAGLAVENLGQSKTVLTTVSQPIVVDSTLLAGRRTPLDAFAVAIAVTVSLMFVCMLLAAGTLALEREQNAITRLVRGLVSREALLTEKVLLASACAVLVTLAMLAGIGAFYPLDWGRAGLWLAALVAGAAAFGALGVAIGVFAREVQTASLLAFLLSLPLLFLALVPGGAVAHGLFDVIRVVSAVFPFKPALEAIDAAINRTSPTLGSAIVHLVAVAAGFGVLARLGMRRLA